MGRLLLVLVLLAFVALVAYTIVKSAERAAAARRARRAADGGWLVEVRKDEQLTVVQLERGEEAYVIGSVSISQPHWEYAERLDALRLEAQDKADALNRRLPP